MKNQQGSTLMMVLIVLLLVSIIATIALKDSVLGLRLATNNQVDNLLLENSNSALFDLEDPSQVGNRLATNEMYGYFLYAANADDILTFCYNAKEPKLFEMTRASVLGNVSKLGSNGYCNASQFSSGRNAVISQIYLQRTSLDDETPFAGIAQGVSIGTGSIGIQQLRMSATAISILPAFSTESIDRIVRCFGRGNDSASIDTTVTCLKEANVPHNVQYAEYSIGTQFKNLNL